ncbi:MAG: RtcB family protein, partial [Bacilli bacterium]
VHNYIDLENNIIRKGACSAQKGEQLIIPINMRDGSIIARGKGNADWNYSAPHGAGRVLSRTKAKEQLRLEDFEKTMQSVWTRSVSAATLDEAPEAYKPMLEILRHIDDTVDVLEIIKPVYNFKSS